MASYRYVLLFVVVTIKSIVRMHAKIGFIYVEIAEKGLSKMNRNHIHMAVGLPGADGVISGMRNSCNLHIHIDTALAIKGRLARYIPSKQFED